MKTTQKNCGKKPKEPQLTQDQIDWIKGKKKIVKGLDKVIKQQELFIEQCNLTLMFLKIYQGNPREFEVIIGADVIERYQFDRGFEFDNSEWVWESIDEMCADIVNGDKIFDITSSGFFSVLHFGKRKNKKTVKDIRDRFEELAQGWWGI